MKSLKGEVVALKRPIAVTTEVEVRATCDCMNNEITHYSEVCEEALAKLYRM